ncbi:MAG: hypothetical protein ABIG60_02790 [Patescibacteria group bacterium]
MKEEKSKKKAMVRGAAIAVKKGAGGIIHKLHYPKRKDESAKDTFKIEQKEISEENIKEEDEAEEKSGVDEIKRNIKGEIKNLLPSIKEARELLESLAGDTAIKVAYLKGEKSWHEIPSFLYKVRHLLYGAQRTAEELEERLNGILEECSKVRK